LALVNGDCAFPSKCESFDEGISRLGSTDKLAKSGNSGNSAESCDGGDGGWSSEKFCGDSTCESFLFFGDDLDGFDIDFLDFICAGFFFSDFAGKLFFFAN
jgi:hypothetical protein